MAEHAMLLVDQFGRFTQLRSDRIHRPEKQARCAGERDGNECMLHGENSSMDVQNDCPMACAARLNAIRRSRKWVDSTDMRVNPRRQTAVVSAHGSPKGRGQCAAATGVWHRLATKPAAGAQRAELYVLIEV